MRNPFFLQKAFDFFVFSSLFIALCAVLMVVQTCILFQIPLNWSLLAFVFSGSVCSYNFHWFLTPPHTNNPSEKTLWNINYRHVHFVLFIAGLIGAGISALLLLENWFWLGITALLTFLYTAPKIEHPAFIWLRKVAMGKTIFLAFAWMHITVLLPMLIAHKSLHAAEICFAVNRFFFIYAICIIFDRRDVEEDRRHGVKSMIVILNDKGIDRLFWGSVITTALTLVILSFWVSFVTVIILSIVLILVGILYQPSKKNHSDYLYYFILDGLMMLSAPFIILSKFVR